jgi:hypothetical protein
MEDVNSSKFRLEALNLAYGILQQKFVSSPPSLTNKVPMTEDVIKEAAKIVQFMGVP